MDAADTMITPSWNQVQIDYEEGWILREWLSSFFLDRLPNLMRITSNQILYILHMLYRASPCYEHTAEWPALGGATVFDRTLKRTIPTCSSTKASQGCAGVSAQNKANLLSMYSRFVNLACVCVWQSGKDFFEEEVRHTFHWCGLFFLLRRVDESPYMAAWGYWLMLLRPSVSRQYPLNSKRSNEPLSMYVCKQR